MSIGFAKKIGMTQIFDQDIPVSVSVLELQPTFVLDFPKEVLFVSKKTKLKKAGVQKIRLAGVEGKVKLQAQKKELEKAGIAESLKIVKEFEVKKTDREYQAGQEINISDFVVGDMIKLSGKTMGRGFTGAVKRWGFHGQPASHGHDHVRAVGSIGSRWPQRVTKGKKMAGRSGFIQQTLNLKIVAIDQEQKLLFVKGSTPGTNGNILTIG